MSELHLAKSSFSNKRLSMTEGNSNQWQVLRDPPAYSAVRANTLFQLAEQFHTIACVSTISLKLCVVLSGSRDRVLMLSALHTVEVIFGSE
jgi:hypothetical protein